jgi:hypothetical protein
MLARFSSSESWTPHTVKVLQVDVRGTVRVLLSAVPGDGVGPGAVWNRFILVTFI